MMDRNMAEFSYSFLDKKLIKFESLDQKTKFKIFQAQIGPVRIFSNVFYEWKSPRKYSA